MNIQQVRKLMARNRQVVIHNPQNVTEAKAVVIEMHDALRSRETSGEPWTATEVHPVRLGVMTVEVPLSLRWDEPSRILLADLLRRGSQNGLFFLFLLEPPARTLADRPARMNAFGLTP